MNNFRKYCAFYIHFAHGSPQEGQGKVHAPLLKKNRWGAFSPCVFFPCVENILGLSQLTNISGGTHAFAARIVPNNNVAIAEFERNCDT